MVAAVVAAAAVTATVSPLAPRRDHQVRVAVNGLPAPAASVHLRGGIASGGRWFGWVPLIAESDGSWHTILRAPGFLGVYPVVVRGGGAEHETGAVVSIIPPGWTGLPTFPKPEQVPEWWARIAPPVAVLHSVTTWTTGFYTHRDPELNRLLPVRFTLEGDWPAQHLRKGTHVLFFSVARLKPTGGWRLLETTSAP